MRRDLFLGLLEFSLGGLEGVDLSVAFLGCFLEVGCHLAFTQPPFGCRIREDEAELACGKFPNPLTSFTLLYNGVAGAAIELAAVFGHKKTLIPLLYACTNHDYHILSS